MPAAFCGSGPQKAAKHAAGTLFGAAPFPAAAGAVRRPRQSIRQKKRHPFGCLFLEVLDGFEPSHEGFADPCLTTWLQHHWSGLRGSNSLPPPWQGGALPDELRPHRTGERGARRCRFHAPCPAGLSYYKGRLRGLSRINLTFCKIQTGRISSPARCAFAAAGSGCACAEYT